MRFTGRRTVDPPVTMAHGRSVASARVSYRVVFGERVQRAAEQAAG